MKGQRNISDLYGIMARQVCHRARHLANAAIGTHGEAKPFHRLAEQLGGRRVQPAKALYTRLIQLGIAVDAFLAIALLLALAGLGVVVFALGLIMDADLVRIADTVFANYDLAKVITAAREALHGLTGILPFC